MPDFVDAKALPDKSEITADLVIVGAGMAGIAMAREFAHSGVTVAVIESGARDFDPAVQDLYGGDGVMLGPEGQTKAMDDYPLTSRRRQLGGSGNVWGAKCAPLDPADFERRPWIAHSGWGMTRAALDPYFDRACDLLQIQPFHQDFDTPQVEGRPPLNFGRRREVFSAPRRYTRLSGARSDRSAYDAFRARFVEPANITCYLNANVAEIVIDPKTGAVARLDLLTLDGRRHTARAQRYVLATGGIENARLLLASRSVEKEGVGNGAGLVGRFFQGHGTFEALTDPAEGLSLIGLTTSQDVALYSIANDPHCVIGLTRAGQVRHRTGNFTCSLVGSDAAQRPLDDAARAIHQLATLVDGAPAAAPPRQRGWYAMTEHLPNPDSRIVLGSRSDALGMPRVRMEWVWSKQAFDSLDRAIAALASAFGEAGLGRVAWPLARERYVAACSVSRHHMGTTRMHKDAGSGVVDQNCRVHGVANLYIAGSSVFPTSGIANPTLTLLALAIRLSDHLKQEFLEAA